MMSQMTTNSDHTVRKRWFEPVAASGCERLVVSESVALSCCEGLVPQSVVVLRGKAKNYPYFSINTQCRTDIEQYRNLHCNV